MTNKYMYFVANWKMYGNLSSLNTLDKVIRFSKSKEIKGGRLIYCPPNTLISSFAKKFNNCQIGIGGQNCHESKDYGAHTGHVNSRMLKNIGAHFVIIGHSENREQGENDKLINLKIKSALDAKIGLKNIKDKSKIFLAYEPVWAIGSGLIPKPQDLFETVEFIKSKFKDKLPKVLYGGSVNPQNITILRKINNIDGFLIGGASQNAKKFIDIVKKTYS
jgi:triosephosphate isomerase (TIM)